MKKLLFIFAILLARSDTYAKTVDIATAKTVGLHYLLQQGILPSEKSGDLKLVYTSGNATPYFYVFGTDSCFVMVSADDRTIPILAYSNNKPFKYRNMPIQVSAFIDRYNKQMDYIISNQVPTTQQITDQWSEILNYEDEKSNDSDHRLIYHLSFYTMTHTVGPLTNTEWDQTQYYNDDCPADASAPAGNGGRVYTGCVATAMAQLMYYWNWPCQGTGSFSYNSSIYSKPYGTLSANFSSDSYYWGNMPWGNVLHANSAVAQLMYDAGVSVKMNYGHDASGSFVVPGNDPAPYAPECASNALQNNFNYAANGILRSSYTDIAWTHLIQGEIDSYRPVIYAGFSPVGGHCWVSDGYQNVTVVATSTGAVIAVDEYLHMNWGWSGNDNGYFTINSLNPGGGPNYASNDEAIVGIQPNYGSSIVNSSCLCTYQDGLINKSAQINNGGYYLYSLLFAGSTCGIAGDPIVNVNSAKTTVFLSGSYTQVVNNFYATVDSKNYFEILPNSLCALPPERLADNDGSNPQPLSADDINVSDNDKGIKVYPNPAQDILNVSFSQIIKGAIYIDVVNALGQKVVENIYPDMEEGGQIKTLSVSKLVPGNYFVIIKIGSEHHQFKFVKD